MRRLLGEEGVDHGQHDHGDQHVRQAAERRKLVGDEQQGAGDDHVAGDEEAGGFAFDAVGPVARAVAQAHPDDKRGGDNSPPAMRRCSSAGLMPKISGMKPVDSDLEALRERADRLAFQQPQRQAAKDQHARKRDDEGRDLPIGDPIALRRADQMPTITQAKIVSDDRPVPLHDHDGGKRADEAHHRADRQVDMAGDDDEQHAERHDDDVAVLQEQVGDVDRPQQRAVGHDLEERHDGDQREQQPVLAHVLDEIGADAVRCAGWLWRWSPPLPSAFLPNSSR